MSNERCPICLSSLKYDFLVDAYMHPPSDQCRFSLERIPANKLLDMCAGVDKESEKPKIDLDICPICKFNLLRQSFSDIRIHPENNCQLSGYHLTKEMISGYYDMMTEKPEEKKQSGSSLKLYSRDGGILSPGNCVVELDGKMLDWITSINFDFPATGEMPKCTISFLLGKLDIANVEVQKKEE